MWNVYSTDEIRTNNNIEGWHRDLKETFGKHRMLWLFLSKLFISHKVEEVYLAKVQTGNARYVKEKRKLVYQRKEDSLRELKQNYEENAYEGNRMQYIRAVAHLQGTAHGEENRDADDIDEADNEDPQEDVGEGDEEYVDEEEEDPDDL